MNKPRTSLMNFIKRLKKLHWYCFTFQGQLIQCGSQATASTYTGYLNKKTTLMRIKENKKFAGVTDNAVLISYLYLGYMTEKKFTTIEEK